MSDFHFRSGREYEFDRNLVLEPLLKEIEQVAYKKEWQPELVFCSGDVAFSGISEDYKLAEEWFNKLLYSIGLDRTSLLVVPGNHDIDVSKLDISHQLFLQNINYSSYEELDGKLFNLEPNEFLDISNGIFDRKESIQALLGKFHGYQRFSQEYLGRPFNESKYSLTEIIYTKSGLKLGVIGLNTSWLFADRGKSSEYGHQLMGIRPLLKALNELKAKGDVDLALVMYHHPTEWLYEAERTTIRETLGGMADLVLEGHQDNPQQQFHDMGTGTKKALVLQEGPAYDGSHYPNRVEFVQCEISNQHKAIEVKSITFDRSNRQWVLDTQTFAKHNRPDSHGYFVLWEAMPSTTVEEEIHISHWDEFYGTCGKFEEGALYILITDPNHSVSREQKSVLGRVDWSLVLDFDPDTHISGLYSSVEAELKMARALHLLTLQERISLNASKGTYWFAALGLRDRPSTLVDNNWREWNRKYSEDLRYLATSFVKVVSERPIICVILSEEVEYVRTICESFDSACGDLISFIFAVGDTEKVATVASTFDAQMIPIDFADICSGLQRMTNKRSIGPDAYLPTLEGAPVLVAPEKLNWLEEDLEIVHLGKGQVEEASSDARQDFLRGMLISWLGLAMHCDIDRDKTPAIQKRIERDLTTRSIRINRLYHWPGAGGTTIARRIIWNLHSEYPTVRLLRVVPEETTGRLREIYNLTKLPLLVAVEGADISVTILESLHNEALSRSLPLVFVLVLRKFERIREQEGIVFVDSTLSIQESSLFAKSYSEVVPERRDQLSQITTRTGKRYRNPFYFGLVAFGKDFISLSDYVNRRLETATDVQKQIILFLAMAYHYGQKAVPAQVFTELLNLPERRIVHLEQALSEQLRELLVQEAGSFWRPAHELIATEILELILTGSATDRKIWKQNLSTWACRFIEIFKHTDRAASDELRDILSRVFILREYTELLGSELSSAQQYAPLIEDIPSSEGRLSVLKKLVDTFPNEPHYWGHLGRFYGIERRQDEKALEAINKAIELDSKNNVFYHMKGMTLRRQALSIMEDCKVQGEISSEKLERIKHLVEEAGQQFEQSCALAKPEEKHGYVSQIQLLVRTVDFGFVISKNTTREAFLISPQSTWYRDLLETAESLLEDLKQKQEGVELDPYTTRCQMDLNELYGDHTRLLEGWNNLLDRRDIYQPLVRRQIARVYLIRKNRSWDDLTPHELSRIEELMAQNMEENAADYRSIRIWFQAVRRIENYSIETAIERLSYWKANYESIDVTFYLYILYTLQTIDGSILASSRASDLISECSKIARPLANRHYSIEWFGKGSGMRRIVHYKQLRDVWEEEFKEGKKLALLDGRISRIFGPESGEIELSSGLRAFFVPMRGYEGRTYIRSQDENKLIKFHLGFSYDGLIAWAVRDA